MSGPLTIGYAGTLMAHSPGTGGGGFIKKVKQWLWTYKPENLNHTTRSGYYLFKGLEQLKKEHNLNGEDIQVQIWGNIDPGNQRQAEAMGVADMVNISGFCSRQETIDRLSKCDVLFLPLESGKDGQQPLFIPGKIYEYLMVGKPIFALAGPSDCRDILEGSGLGITADPFNTNEVAKKLYDLVQKKAELTSLFNANESFVKQYDFRNIAKKLSAIFDEVQGV